MKVKNIGWSFIGLVVPLCVAVVCIPLILEKIGIEQFGILTIVWAIVGYASVLDFGVGRALIYTLANEGSVELERRMNAINSAIVVTLKIIVAVLPFLVIALYFWREQAEYVGFDDAIFFLNFTLGLCISVALQALITVFRSVCELDYRFFEVSLIRMMLGVTNFAAPLIVLRVNESIVAIVYALMFSKMIGLLLFFISAKLPWRSLLWNAQGDASKLLLRFGGWHTLGNLVNQAGSVIERLFLASFVSLSAVSIYVIPYEMAAQSLIMIGAITSVLYPHISSLSSVNKSDARLMYIKWTLISILIMLAVLIVFWLLGDYLLELWLRDNYQYIQHSVLKILGVGLIFYSIDTMSLMYLQATGRVRLTGQIQCITFLTYIPFLLIMIETHGIVGAAYSWVFKCAMNASMQFYCTRSA